MLWLGGESYGAEDETSKPADEIPDTQSENLEGMNDDTPRPRRYEIDHWHDHIRSLQAWWSGESIEDSWWSDLLTELLIFTRPENCIKTKTEETHPRQTPTVEALKALKVLSFSLRDDDFSMASLAFIGAMDNEQLVDFLSLEFVMDRLAWKQRMFNLEKVIAALDPELRVTWLAYQKCNIPSIAADKFEFLQRLASRTGRLGPWHPGLVEDINHFLEGLSYDKVRAADKLRLLIAMRTRLNSNIERYYDISSPSFATPLARYFFDSELDDAYEDDLTIPNSVWSFKPRMPPLLAILQNLSEQNDPSEEILQRYLESAKILIAEGACLDVEGEGGLTVLHLAARIRNLKLFKLLCVSWECDVRKGDNFGWTPLHYLFKDTPNEPSRIKGTLGICEVILKMKGQGRIVVDLVDAEDNNSETPLAFAVRARFKEAVDALIEPGANVHDEDCVGGNCFDHLAFESDGTDPETEVAIANTLFEAGADCTKRTKGRYPLTYAIIKRKTHLIEVFLPKYSEKGKQCPDNNPVLGRDGYSWEHGLTC
ncbi:Histone-lysine N-methyltransferase ehmt2 [Orbilia oligospora]|nr:Histone-lysine N-methyltransferase ehmt2 [Orbilia oligospora]